MVLLNRAERGEGVFWQCCALRRSSCVPLQCLEAFAGQRVAIDGEVVLAKSPRSIGAQQHFGEHGSHFVVHRGDDIDNRGEVRPGYRPSMQ